MTDHLSFRVPNIGEEMDWASSLDFDIKGVYCESDAGLLSSERIGDALKLKQSNGINQARRNKYLMNKSAKAFGLNTVEQKLCKNLDEALEFARKLGLNRDTSSTENTRRCVVKPLRGVASEEVYLCDDLLEVEQAFNQVKGSQIYGSPHKTHKNVLVQEFAEGIEYAVDIVSRNGEHKVAALWKYDKRAVNGAPFVYHATMLADANTVEGKVACEYAMSALDAVQFKWGLSHVEVMVDTELNAKLIEINCRQHNTDFAPMTTVCIGYNALDMLLAAYFFDVPESNFPLDTKDERLDWDMLPKLPTPLLTGAIVHLVCHVEGEVMEVRGLDQIDQLSSVQALHLYPSFSVGNYVEKTIDIRSDSGFAHLINADEDEFFRDYNEILKIMPKMFLV